MTDSGALAAERRASVVLISGNSKCVLQSESPVLRLICPLLALACAIALGGSRGVDAQEPRWGQVHPHWWSAYVASFRSPDLLTEDPDEQWGREDGRLVAGGILSDFPAWLSDLAPDFEEARRDGRPILLSLHLHSGFGTGLVSYSENLRTAEVTNYPWLIRALLAADLADTDVTVTVDTCNAQSTAAHQVRPDLVPRGVAGWAPFERWRRHPARKALSQAEAYRLFSRDRVSAELYPAAARRRTNVQAAAYLPLTRSERRRFRAAIYGPRGVIFATPALANVLRLGPEPRKTLTAELLRDRLETRLVDDWLSLNRREFQSFREFAFFTVAGSRSAATE